MGVGWAVKRTSTGVETGSRSVAVRRSTESPPPEFNLASASVLIRPVVPTESDGKRGSLFGRPLTSGMAYSVRGGPGGGWSCIPGVLSTPIRSWRGGLQNCPILWSSPAACQATNVLGAYVGMSVPTPPRPQSTSCPDRRWGIRVRLPRGPRAPRIRLDGAICEMFHKTTFRPQGSPRVARAMAGVGGLGGANKQTLNSRLS